MMKFQLMPHRAGAVHEAWPSSSSSGAGGAMKAGHEALQHSQQLPLLAVHKDIHHSPEHTQHHMHTAEYGRSPLA
jgi:hypothetical protein